MNTLIKKVIEYKKNKNDFVFEEIIEIITPLINKQVSKINIAYAQDLRQELLLTIYKALLKFKPKKELISKNLKLIEIKSMYSTVIMHEYYEVFKLKYKEYFSLYSFKKDDMVQVINEFYLYCNQNQFRKYIKIILNNKYIDFIRKYKINEELKIISLNIVNDYGDEELLYKIMDKNLINTSYEIDYSLLTNKEKNFLNLFYKDKKKLKEIEVAKILGISQQAVSKRLIKIKNKLKKF